MLPRTGVHLRTAALPLLAPRHITRSASPCTKSFASINSDTSIRKQPSAIADRMPDPETTEAKHRLREFGLNGRVFAITGGAQGLGFATAEALVEGGAHAYCLDRQPKPSKAFLNTRDRLAHHFQGTLHYRQVDVLHETTLNDVMSAVAAKHGRMDGLIAAAAMQHVQAALDIPAEKITEMMDTNFRGVLFSARSCARQMIKYKTPGSIVLIGSMSGLNANKGFDSCVYNGSKAAVIQLGRNLAMEWAHVVDGKAIRVNVLSPGNIMTPMVENDFRNDPKLREIWEKANMLGRISETHEYRGAALFMLSDASSFMTGANVVIDGGYTAW